MPDFPPILVTFARPEESRGLRRRLREQTKMRFGDRIVCTGVIDGIRLAIAHTGIGPESAARAIELLVKDARFQRIIAAGFAGALSPELSAGEVVTDFRTGPGPDRIVSRALPVETPVAKSALHHETGALAVDMETETLAEACRARRVPFTAVRAISDTAGEALPVPFAIWFDVRRQHPRALRLLFWLAMHPARVAPFVRFVRRLSVVGESLAGGIVPLLSREKTGSNPMPG